MAAPRCCALLRLHILSMAALVAATATEFAQVPPVTFPGRVPVNRQLSLQQQTQILKDVQQHHRFSPLELPSSKGPLLYTQQSVFPGGSPQQAANPPAFQHHQQQTSSNPPAFQHHQQSSNPPAFQFQQQTSKPPAFQYQQQTSKPPAFQLQQQASNPPAFQRQQQTSKPPTFQFQQSSFSATPAPAPQHTTAFQYDASQFGLKNSAVSFHQHQQQPTTRTRARLVDGNEAVYLQDNRQKLFQQIKDYNDQHARASPQPPTSVSSTTNSGSGQFFFRPTVPSSSAPRFVPTPTTADDGQRHLQEQLQKQFTTQLQHRQDLIRKLKLALVNAEINDRQAATASTQVFATSTTAAAATTTTTTSTRPPPTEIYLSDVDGKLQVFNSEDDVINLQAVRSAQAAATATTPATPVVVATTTPAPTVSFEELSKGVLPPGAQFEVIRHKQDGELEEVGKLPVNLPQKKVTFVFLEEQPDGTLKVQGVKANADQGEKSKESSPEDIESILKKLQEGEIKLPPSNKLSPTPTPSVPSNHRFISRSSSVDSIPPTSQQQQAVVDSNLVVPQPPVEVRPEIPPTYFPSTHLPAPAVTSASSSATPYVVQHQHQELVSAASQSGAPFNEFVDFSGKSKAAVKVPTPPPASSAATTSSPSSPRYRSTTTTTPSVITTERALPQTEHQKLLFISKQTQSLANHSNFRKNVSPTPPLLPESVVRVHEQQPLVANDTLMQVLKASGLFAMARFLKESSLDKVLNETGPYTIFVPTDKAFRALLVQLGGPEKAEEKFRENPRLLSGLLLHHVVPGGFKLASLQDEMTGVSLAGTQLRVNTYTAQDTEWNDLKVVTINGARVVPGLQDLVVPQGVMHAVDRVMFPLPVGDLLQTLLADRDARFDSFLRAVRTSGLAPVLAGSKTHTLLAPTERAFALLSPEERTRVLTERDAARALVTRHVVRGALYTAGLRFYQVKDSLAPEHQLTLTLDPKGHLKVNSVPVVTQNIPATNGVVHAMDNLL